MTQLVLVYMERHVGEKFRGVRGIFSLYDLLGGVDDDQSTTANVWVQGGPIEHKNYITAGSIVIQFTLTLSLSLYKSGLLKYFFSYM